MDDSRELAALLEGYTAAITVLLQRNDLGCFVVVEAGSEDAPIVEADGTVLGMLGDRRGGELGIRWWNRLLPP